MATESTNGNPWNDRLLGRPTIPLNDVRVCLISGGDSRRMGRDKALLPHPDGGTWLSRTLILLAKLQRPVTLLSHHGDHLQLADAMAPHLQVDVELLREPPPRQGPLLALQRLMEHHPDRALLLCAVDMPWLTISALETLLGGRDPAPGRHGPALVGTDGERLHPLPGLYPNDRDRVRALRCFRASGGRSLQGWLGEVGCRAIPLPAGPLRNANRPEDLTTLRPDPWGP